MYKKILVPVSMKHSGDRTHKALAHAMGICDGEIVLLHITNPVPSLVGGAARKELVDEETSAGRAALAPLLEKLDEAGIRHHTRIDFGVVATVIVKKLGAFAAAGYVLAGLAGLPIFAGGSGDVTYVLHPTNRWRSYRRS